MLWPALMAVLSAALFIGAVGIFLLALQYYKHGRLSWRRTITTLLAVLYIFGLFSYTMLPLPETRDAFCRPGVAEVQLVPFQFLDDFQLALASGKRAFLTSFTLWQVLLNVLLFIPVGIFAVRWLRANAVLATLLGAGLSLLIEATQFTGVWGIYTCAYRVADVDDLLVNTTGALIGTLLAYLPIFAFLSGPREPDAIRQPAREVGRARRALAAIFDLAFITAGFTLVSLLGEIGDRLGMPARQASGWQVAGEIVIVLAVLVLPAALPGRATLGQRCSWFQLRDTQGHQASALRSIVRTLLGLGGIYLTYTLLGLLPTEHPLNLLRLVVGGYTVLSVIWLIFDATARGLSARLSSTGFSDRRA